MGRSRILGAVAPGLPQILRGRWAMGGFALGIWLLHLGVLVARWDRVRGALAEGPGAQISVAALLAGLVWAWRWSYREMRVSEASGGADGAISQWGMTVRLFRRNRVAVIGLLVIIAAYLIALLTPLIAPYPPDPIDNLSQRFAAPTLAHPLGLDQFGRDVLSRLMYGARISLSIGFIAVAISVTIGTLLGAVSGFAGGKVDAVIMRFVDMVLSFPRLVLLITVIAIFSPSIFIIVAVLGLTQWPATARIVRGEVLSLREREFVEAARALGFRRSRIVLRHLVPNAMAPVIVAATLGIGNTIVLEAGLSFLGMGVQAPTASWGTMLNSGQDVLLDAWWLTTFPGLAIVLTVVAFNVVGDGLRDALDPRLR